MACPRFVLAAALLSVGASLERPRPALADLASQVAPLESESDRVYGRFDGDWDLGLGAGVVLDKQAPRLAIRTSAHYFSTAGLYFAYADPLTSATDAPRHELGLGVDLRPMFLPRLALDLHSGATWSNLVLDSVSLSLGAFWARQPEGRPATVRGFETTLGVGFPLLLRAGGPWLEARGRLQYPDPAQRQAASLLLLLTWHALWLSPLATSAP